MYRGKYPHRINTVSCAKGQLFISTNGGETLRLDPRAVAAATGGKLPQVGQEVADYKAFAIGYAPFVVTVTALALESGKTYETKHAFETAEQATRFMVDEMKWESTVRVQCPTLGIDAEGDYVNVSHTFRA